MTESGDRVIGPSGEVKTLSRSTLHKVYAAAIAGIVALAIIVGTQWAQHVRDDAQRDAVIDAQKTAIGDIDKRIAGAKQEAAERIAALEVKKQKVTPAQAPLIIRELIPGIGITPEKAKANQSQPVVSQQGQPAAAGEQKLPDAPEAQDEKPLCLSTKDQVRLAQFGLSCQQSDVEREQLKAQTSDQEQVIEKQKVELDAAMKAAKGGSVWQRTKRVLKWGAIFGAVGYVAGRVQR
jgi:hypothetical protein